MSFTKVNAPTLMRDALCNTLIECAERDSRIVALDADLVSSSGLKPFFKKFPNRSINCGIAEANMMGVAAGLSLTGKIPFAHSFGPFATRRVCDQIFVSQAYAHLNVRVIGSDPGVTAAYNGGTHMPFEDMAVLRSIPEITLLEPADPIALANLVTQLSSDEHYGIYYLRVTRKDMPAIYSADDKFNIGKGNVIRAGGDLTIFASGIMVAEAMLAADALSTEGVDARVVDMFTWKPIDAELVERCASETGRFVVAENHNVYGGLGAAIAEAAARTRPVPIEFVGVDDRFGQVGKQNELQEIYGLTSSAIISAAVAVTGR
ncbi:MAG: transketolase family protein [Oscillospiraceae bacterium]|jgi:transketolase|nr:transketolase family protein [Oscillospiraceae bacterium]